MNISIPVSPGEMLDKLTILEIKLEEITDETKLANIQSEYALLQEALVQNVSVPEESLDAFSALREELLVINKKIWDSENDIREFWKDDVRFIAAAKQSHFYNDERARVKRAINNLLGSSIVEEKSHPKYEHTI